MTDLSRPASTRPALLATSILLVSLVSLVSACGGTTPSASPGSTAAPTPVPTPSATPIPDGIQHPTGATDVILRIEQGGGFAPIESMATSAPIFTLYGDGTVVWRDPAAAPPDPVGNVNRLAPFLTIRLDEEGVQALLVDAIGRGGLGRALAVYQGQGADIPSTTFTITADGQTKTVTVVGLSAELHPQDVAIVTTLAALADRLQGFAGAVAGEHAYQPAAFRGVLMKVDQPFGAVVAWPWPDIGPGDFVSGENEFLQVRTMTPAEVATLEIPNVAGGLSGVTLHQATQNFSFSLRPLLPDETK